MHKTGSVDALLVRSLASAKAGGGDNRQPDQPHGRRPLMALSRRLIVLVVAMLTLLVAVPLAAQPVKLVAESYHVPARDPGIQLFVRNKRPETMTSFTPDRIVLFVHGATFPAETSFDL